MLGVTMASPNINLKTPLKVDAVLSSHLSFHRYQIKALNTTHFSNISNKTEISQWNAANCS